MATSINLLPRAGSNFFSGQIQSYLSPTAEYFVGDNLPPTDKLPIYLIIDKSNPSKRELVKVYEVSGNNVYIKRGLNNGGVGIAHNQGATYEEVLTIDHLNKIIEAIENGWAYDHTDVYTFTKLSDTSFKIVGVDRTNHYTTGRAIRFNGTDIGEIISSDYSENRTRVTVSGASVPETINTVELYLSKSFTKEHKQDGTHKQETVTTLKATGEEVNAGIDDAKIVTPKAIKDSYLSNVYSSIFRQAIINGNFDIWQRGTSFTLTQHSGTYTADRWFVSQWGNDISDEIISRKSEGAPAGSSYYLETKQYKDSGFDGGNSRILTILEGEIGEKLAGKTVTLSFKYRVPTAYTNNWRVFGRYDTDDNTLNSNACSSSGAETLGNNLFSEIILSNVSDWTLATKTFSIPSNCKRIMIVFGSYDNTVNGATFHLAQVQLNVGSVALPFQPKSFAEELMACQRYFEKSFNYNITPQDAAGEGGAAYKRTESTSAYHSFFIQFKVRKMKIPTLTFYNPSVSDNNKVRNLSDGTNHPASSSIVGENSFRIFVNNSSIGADKDLICHWTAEAEL